MRITGSDARNSVASAFSSTPTDTSPITRPCAFRIGAFARIDLPSDPGLLADERLAREDRRRILAGIVQQRLPDHLRIRMRHADAAAVRDDDEGCAGGPSDSLGDRVDDPRAVRLRQRRDDLPVCCDRLRDRE